MLAKEQYIGAAILLLMAAAVWTFVIIYRPTPDPGQSDSELTWQLQDSLRRDSIARAKARRDSLREARWEHMKDSFRRLDDARFAAWTAERQARYDSFRLADSLWKDSVGWRFPRHLKKDTILDLNHCDTAELQFIRGIGRYTAQQIVRYRDELGGYHSPQQLTDEPFSKLRLDTVLQYFTVNPNDVRRMDVNTASADYLARHPYLRYAQAKAIYELRRKRTRLRSIDELQEAGIDSLTISKIAPYLRFAE